MRSSRPGVPSPWPAGLTHLLMEDVMYDPPAYLWAITIAGPVAVAALTCIVLYRGAERSGLGRKRSALLAGAAAVVLGGWLTASAVIAGHGWYRTLPWFPVAIAGYLGLLLARPVRPGVPGHVRRVLPRAAGYRRHSRPRRPHRPRGRARHQAFRRPAAPARFRPRPHRRPGAHLPGRADHWLRSVRPPRRLGGRCRAPATRQDRLPHHPLHGRGGIPGRPDHGAFRRAHRG